MSTPAHILYQRLRPGTWLPVLFLCLVFTLLVNPAAHRMGYGGRMPAERHSISAEEREPGGIVLSDDHMVHRGFSIRSKAKIPSFFKRSIGSYATAVLLYIPAHLRVSSFLSSTLLRPGYYLFLFRYTPF